MERAQSSEVAEIMQQILTSDEPATPQTPEPEQQPVKEPNGSGESLGPQPKLELDDGSFATDKDGNKFDAEKHSQGKDKMGGTLNTDGTFKKKRSTKKEAPVEKVPVKEEPAEETVSGWPASSAFDGGGDGPEAGEPAAEEDDNTGDGANLDSMLDAWGA